MPRIALCGMLTIGVDSSEPKTPPLVMRERAAGQFLDRDRAVARTRREAADALLDVGKAQRVSASRSTGTIRPRSVETATPMS